MSEAERPLQVGLCGHRSFIARALEAELRSRAADVLYVAKSALGTGDWSGLDCLYLVLGRERPTEAEAEEELAQVRSYCANPHSCLRTVYVSSRLDMPHKRLAEAYIQCDGGIWVRPPAVFGPRQSTDSEMLIPSLVRSEGRVELRRPNAPSRFISAEALAVQLAGLADPKAWAAQREFAGPEFRPMMTFEATPRQIRDLYLAFEGLRLALQDDALDA